MSGAYLHPIRPLRLEPGPYKRSLPLVQLNLSRCVPGPHSKHPSKVPKLSRNGACLKTRLFCHPRRRLNVGRRRGHDQLRRVTVSIRAVLRHLRHHLVTVHLTCFERRVPDG